LNDAGNTYETMQILAATLVMNNGSAEIARGDTNGFRLNTAGMAFGSEVTITGGGTSNVPTLTSGPVTGNPTKWLPYNDNGTTRYVPSW
jgi:hypothetical protein